MSKAVQLYPHAVSGGLHLRLSDFDDPVTGETVAVRDLGRSDAEEEEGLPASAKGYDASPANSRKWSKLTFKLTATLPTDDIAKIVPDTSDLSADTSLIVLLTCPSTKLRHGICLNHAERGLWTGYGVVQREDVRSIVWLRPQLLRVTGIPTDEALPYATKAGSMIAFGEGVPVYIDPTPRLLNSTVVTMWEDFANSDDVWRREHPDDVFHLEPFVDPRLYLNSRYSQLREVLESSAKRGPDAALRDLTATLIAQPVLTQLATASLAALEPDEDSNSVSVPNGWRGDLVASVLPRLYPEEVDEEERARRAAREIRDADGAASIQSRLGTVIQEMVASFRVVETAIRTYESAREREEVLND